MPLCHKIIIIKKFGLEKIVKICSSFLAHCDIKHIYLCIHISPLLKNFLL